MMKIRWPPTYFTDGNKMIFLFDIYYMAYLSSISYAVILFQGNNGKTRNEVSEWYDILLSYITKYWIVNRTVTRDKTISVEQNFDYL